MSSNDKWVNRYFWNARVNECNLEISINRENKTIRYSFAYDNQHMDSGDKTFTFAEFIELHKNGPEYNHIIKHNCGIDVCEKIIETIQS